MDTIDGRPVVVVDIETRSGTDLSSCGVYRYVEDPDFDILLTGYAVGDGDPLVLDHPALAKEGRLKEEMSVLSSVIYDPSIVKVAHNAAFERTCFEKYLGRRCDPAEWIDTMVLAAYCGLPLSLDGCTKALGFGESTAKDARGKALIRLFSCPRKPTKDNPAIWVNPEDEPEKWRTYVDYNRQDVVAERALLNALYPHRPDETEHRFWCLDQQINDRGIRIDRTLAANAQAVGQAYKAELFDKAVEITGLENPKSVAQVKDWLNRQEGISVASLNKKVVADVVAQLTTDKAREFMTIRSELSKSADAKYDAMLRAVCHDDHVRGCFQFYGSHTGRFSGRLVQLQNLKKNEMSDLAEARALVRSGDLPTVEALYGQVSNTLGELVRTALIPEPGQRFIVSDFSAIEARVTAWLSGEENTLRAFRDGEDIYCATASSMFGVPVEKHGANAALRQKGKIAVLACVAKGQPVLTDQGLVPIEDVTTDMLVWDGEEFVSHDGVAFNGYREVIEYEGLQATADHLVWVEGEREPVRFGCAAGSGAHLVQSGAGRGEQEKELARYIGKVAVYDIRNAGRNHRYTVSGKLVHNCGYGGGVNALKAFGADKMGLSEEDMADIVDKWRASSPRVCAMWKGMERAAIKAVARKTSARCPISGTVFDWRDGLLWMILPSGRRLAYYGAEYGDSRLHPGKKTLSYMTTEQKSRKWMRVETWGGKLVENCWAAGTPVLTTDGWTPIENVTTDMGVWDGVRWVYGVSGVHTKDTDTLWDVDGLLATPDHRVLTEKGWVAVEDANGLHRVSVQLPDGGRSWRPPRRARLSSGQAVGTTGHPKPVYDIINCGPLHRYVVLGRNGPIYSHNCVQAVARDILRDKMLALDDAGFDIRAHIHDEVVITAAPEQTLEEVNAIMGAPLDWCPDLPLRGDGYYCDFYMKD